MSKELSAILTATAAFALWQGTARAISLNLVPAPQNTFLGNTVNVGVTISDLGDGAAPSLSTYDLDISFDDTVLDFSGVTFGDPSLGDQLALFGVSSLTETEEPSFGLVNIFELSFNSVDELDDSQADSFTLATLTFNTIATGTSPLGLSINALGDALGDPLTAEIGNSFVSVSSQPVTVPEPSFTLVGFGLTMGLGGLLKGRDRSRSQQS